MLSTQLATLSRSLASAKTQLLLSTSLLQHLESTNVYNDAFQIGHAPLAADGGRSSITVGTINGLRLGGRPAVEWDEINAAWGLVALCIDRLAVKVGCIFETCVRAGVGGRAWARGRLGRADRRYRIVPLGSFSRIEELSGRGVYELYASSDISPARLLQNRRFNYALTALLDCLRQLIEFGRKNGRGWASSVTECVEAPRRFPFLLPLASPASYPLSPLRMRALLRSTQSLPSSNPPLTRRISKDRINGHSIRLPGLASGLPTLGSMSLMGLGGSTGASGAAGGGGGGSGGGGLGGGDARDANPDVNWTRACRSVLQVLKRILVVESEAGREAA